MDEAQFARIGALMDQITAGQAAFEERVAADERVIAAINGLPTPLERLRALAELVALPGSLPSPVSMRALTVETAAVVLEAFSQAPSFDE
jgi:hypothetical protein